MKTNREQLKAAMHLHGISQRKLAQTAGVSESQVSHFVNDKRDITTRTLDRLQAAIAQLTKEVG